jgi:penicillin-binding protein 1A
MSVLRRKPRARREPVFDSPPRPDAPTAARAGKMMSSGRKRASRARSPLRRLAYWSVVLGLWLVIAACGTVVWVAANLPPIQSLEIPKRPPSIEIVSSDGKTIANRGEMHGATLTLRELPPYLPKAFIAIEDRRFYSHLGIDPVGLARAMYANVSRRSVAQGGSTITQQLAKNLFLTQERTIIRKLQELILALWLENRFGKTEILELYLNRVYFGSGAYGVDAAAQRYFGKSAKHVTIAEAAVLAGLVRSPSRLAPNRNPEGAQRRAQLVIAAMTDQGHITQAMAKQALAKPAQAVRLTGTGSANYIADWIMDVLDDLVGRIDQDLVVRTSIDSTLQATAENALVGELTQKGDKLGVSQGALVSMTPTGAVRAMVGGKNYGESQFNRAVAARRQPGSAFKPFVFLTALERGLTPDTVREDRPISIKGWRPENYSREYYGPVTLTQGLAHSLNTISVRLTMEVGPTAVARTAHRLGIASKLEANPSLALGTSEVSVMELVAAYAPFANGGNAIAPYVVERVTTKAGKTLYQHTPHNLGVVIEPRYVAMMNTMMRETLRAGTATRAQLPSWMAAGKTGTSQDFRDAWFIGYTAYLVTGVWIGNDDSSPTRRATGGGMPVDIWTRYMRTAHQGVAVAALPGHSGPSFASIFEQATSPNPLPPAGVGSSASAQRPQQPSGSLDGWLIDRLFGRR